MPCPSARSNQPTSGRQQGFDQWVEEKLGVEREVVLSQLHQLIRKQLEVHHAQVVSEIEKQLVMIGTNNVQLSTRSFSSGSRQDIDIPGDLNDSGKNKNAKAQANMQPRSGFEGSFPQTIQSQVDEVSRAPDQRTSLTAQQKSVPIDINKPSPKVGTGNSEMDAASALPCNKTAPALPIESKSKVGNKQISPDSSHIPKSTADDPQDAQQPQRKPSYQNQRLAALANQDDSSKQDCLARIVNNAVFEVLIVTLILLNSAVIALEAQYVGYDVGYHLGYPEYNTPSRERFPWIQDVVNVASLSFTAIFLVELVMRLGAYKLDSWRYPMLAFDIFLVVVSGADLVAAGYFGGVNPTAIRILRVMKLLRMMRILRNIEWFQSLFLIVRSIMASYNALFWAFTLLLLLQTCVGMILSQGLQIYLEDETQDKKTRIRIFGYFGTFTRTMITLFEISLGNWVPVARILIENVSEWFGLFFIFYSCTLCFAVVNVIRAVFIAETARIAAGDDEIAMMRKEQNKIILVQKLQDVFEELDDSGDGVVNQQEFDQLLTDTVMQKYLSTLDVDVNDMKALFKILDDGDGNISLDEFCKGVVMVKGQAKAMDMIKVEKCVLRLEKTVEKEMKSMREAASDNR